MTTIATVKGEGWVVMACDSQITRDDHHPVPSLRGKIISTEQTLVSFTGDNRVFNILQDCWIIPKENELLKGEKLDGWMGKVFVPSIQEVFKLYNYKDTDGDGDGNIGAGLIVAINGVVYTVSFDYSYIRREQKITTAGSGGPYAHGALCALLKEEVEPSYALGDALNKVIEAVKIACENDIHSGGEVKTAIWIKE